jgi:hypothetical protein
MDNQIVRIFYGLDAAERARDALLAAGFDRGGIELEVLEDEAGPEQANFTVGDSPEVAGGTGYEDTFRPKEPRHTHVVVTVFAADKGLAQLAATILEGQGGRIPDPAAR